MRYLLSLIFLLFVVNTFGQIIVNPSASYYHYTPLTGDATVSIDMVQVFGSELRTRLSKQSPQRWMVIVGVDSTQGLSKIYYNLPEDSTFTYYHSIFQRDASGDTIYGKGANKTFHTLTSEPYNLLADGGVNKITLTWASSPRAYLNMIYVADSIKGTFTLLDSTSLSTYTHSGLGTSVTKAYKVRTKTRIGAYTDYSNIADAETDSAVIPPSRITYSPTLINFGTLDTLSYSITTDSTIASITQIEHIDTTLHIDSTLRVDTTFTVSGGTFTPNVLGIDDATNWTNFPFASAEGSNTATITNGWFHFHQDSTFNYHNANYRRGLIPLVSDTLYFGMRMKVGTLPMYNFVSGGEHLVLSVWDSTNSRTTVGVGFDDNTLDSIMDNWYVTYYTTFSASSSTPTSFNALSDTVALQIRVIKGTSGSIQTKVNGTVISNITGINLSNDNMTHLRLGTTDTGNDYVTNNEFYFDKVYADSTTEPNTTWWIGTAIDTTWIYTNVWTKDTTLVITHTYIPDTTWTVFNDTIYATSTLYLTATNTGESASSILSGTGLSAPFSTDYLTESVLLVGESVQIPIVFNRSYGLGTYTDTLVITDNDGTNNIIITGVLTTPGLEPPTGLTVTHNTDTTAFKLNWTRTVSTADSTLIEMSTDGTTFSQIGHVGVGIETYTTPTSYTYGDKRYFRLRSKRSSTYSNYTSIVNYILPDAPIYTPPDGNWTYDLYVTPTGAGTHSGADLSNAMTLQEAVSAAVAGDTVFVQKGLYPLVSNIVFSNSGTAANPIVFRGVRADENERTASSTNNTVIRQDNSTTNGAISISGDYITFDNLILLEQYPKNLLSVSSSSDHFKMDSVVTQYPSNVGSSSNHAVLVKGTNTQFYYCYFWRSPRTIVWVESMPNNNCNNFIADYCTFDDYSNHYAIQCMPATSGSGNPDTNDPQTYYLLGGRISNCLFINGNWDSGIYIRHVKDYKIYNNLFVNGGSYYGVINFEATNGSVSSPAYDANSIFANNTIYDTRAGTGVWNSGTNELVGHGFTNMQGWTFANNLVSAQNATYLYRLITGRSTSGCAQYEYVDYNMYYLALQTAGITSIYPNASCVSTTYTWAQWKSTLGFDTHSIIDTNPNFVNPTTDPATWDFHLGTQRLGTNLSAWGITTDRDGVTRTNWTIGAYEKP